MARALTPKSDQGGAVLVVAVLVTLALLGLGHVLLVSAEAAYLTSAAHARIVELDARAAGAVQAELARGWASWMDSVGVGGRHTRTDSVLVPVPAVTWVTWRRLSSEAWLVEASVAQAAGARAARLRRLVWVYDPGARVGALPGVVSTGPGAPVSIGGSIVTDTAPAVGVVDEAALGLLSVTTLVAAADSVGPVGTPAPIDGGGTCDTGPVWNWGDPLGPNRPCGGYRPLKGRPSSLLVDGGEGQGVLVVDGDVTFRAGALHHGVVVASGRVDVLDGSVIEGRVIAFGGLLVEAGASVVGSPDRARLALEGARETVGGALVLHEAARLGPG